MAIGGRKDSSSLQFYFGVIAEGHEASYNRLRAEKCNKVLDILQLLPTYKQQDEDPMVKGARDGKAEVYPDVDREAMVFALNFTLVTFFVSSGCCATLFSGLFQKHKANFKFPSNS